MNSHTANRIDRRFTFNSGGFVVLGDVHLKGTRQKVSSNLTFIIAYRVNSRNPTCPWSSVELWFSLAGQHKLFAGTAGVPPALSAKREKRIEEKRALRIAPAAHFLDLTVKKAILSSTATRLRLLYSFLSQKTTQPRCG
jgi:hypothetical protein